MSKKKWWQYLDDLSAGQKQDCGDGSVLRDWWKRTVTHIWKAGRVETKHRWPFAHGHISFILRSVVVSLQYKWKVITASNWSGISQASLCLAIRVIDCLDTLSGGIISLWLHAQLGSDPGAKWLKSKGNQAQGEWAKVLIYDKIQHFHYTWKLGVCVGKIFFISYVVR